MADISVEDDFAGPPSVPEAIDDGGTEEGDSPAAEASTSAINGEPKQTRKRQQLSCADCHRRKQKCDRQIPCKPCIERGVAASCHIAEAGTNKRKKKTHDDNGNPIVPRKRRKRAEIEADAQRELIVARARQVVTKAAAGDEEALGQLQRFVGPTTYPEDQPSYVGPASIENFISTSGGATSFLPSLPAEPLTLAGSDLLFKMQPKELCDHLIEVFIDYSRYSYTIQYTPIALHRHYENLWHVLELRKAGQQALLPATVEAVTHSFVFLVNMCCVLALQMLPADSVAFVSKFGDPLELRQKCYTTAREALMRSELEELPDLCRIEAITMTGAYLKNEGRPNDQYILHASAIRAAQALGMHRRAPARWNLDPFDNEMRKRVWCAVRGVDAFRGSADEPVQLYTYDRYSSFHLGRPPVVQDSHCDVELPLNLSREDLHKGNFAAAKPRQEYTSSTFLISECILGGIVGRVFDRAFSTHTPDYSTVLELDTELRVMEENLPPALRSPTPDDKMAHPGIENIHRTFMMVLCKIRAMLHRPFLLKPYPPTGETDKFARSRQIMIMLSRQQIILARALLEDLPPHVKNNFLYSHVVWEASCQLAVAIHALPNTPENTSEAKKLDAQVMQARVLLEDLAIRNRTAANAIRMLDFLRARYAMRWSLDAPVPSFGAVPLDPLLGGIEAGIPTGSSQTPVSALQDETAANDPLNFLLQGESLGQQPAYDTQNQWNSVGGIFETGADWQNALDVLLSQVGELT